MFDGSLEVAVVASEPCCNKLVDRLSLEAVESEWEACGGRPMGPLSRSDAAFVDLVGHGCVATAVDFCACIISCVTYQDIWFL